MKKYYIQPECSEIRFGTNEGILSSSSIGYSSIESFTIEDDSLEWN